MTGVEREAGTQSHLVITQPVGGDAINGGTHIAYLASKEPSKFLLKRSFVFTLPHTAVMRRSAHNLKVRQQFCALKVFSMSIKNSFSPSDQLIRAIACATLLNISKSAFYDWINPNSPRFKADFPQRIRLSSRVIGWRLAEVNAWISSKQAILNQGGAK